MQRQAQRLGMMNFTDLPPVPSNHLAPFTDQLRLAVAAYLARFKGASRDHTCTPNITGSRTATRPGATR